MNIDYYRKVLGLKKNCNKKEIVQAYLRALRENPTPKQHALYDRALAVLRIRYLTHVYTTRGEAGLHEQRSAEIIQICSIAVAQMLEHRSNNILTYNNPHYSECESVDDDGLINFFTPDLEEKSNSNDRKSVQWITHVMDPEQEQRKVSAQPFAINSRVTAWLNQTWTEQP